MAVGQFTAPRFPTSLPFTNQRSTGLSLAMAMCDLSEVSRSCGMLSPNFAFDIRLVQLSLCNCAWESQLMRPCLIFMLVPPMVEWQSWEHYLSCRSWQEGELHVASLPQVWSLWTGSPDRTARRSQWTIGSGVLQWPGRFGGGVSMNALRGSLGCCLASAVLACSGASHSQDKPSGYPVRPIR